MDANLLIILAAIVVTAVFIILLSRRHAGDASAAQKLIDHQTELAGRISQLTEQQALAQNQLSQRLQTQERTLAKALEDRLGDVSRRIGESLQKQSTQTTNTMGELKARLAVITAAQDNITKLSAQVVSLQDVLANKQARGAFGETQLAEVPIPAALTHIPGEVPLGAPFNVAQIYRSLGQAIKDGKGAMPDFDFAVDRHKLLAAMEQSSNADGKAVAL